MKKRSLITLSSAGVFVLVMMLMSSCSHHAPMNRKGFLPPVSIRISSKVKKDSAAVAFIRASEKVINELSDRVEYIAQNEKDLLQKDNDDLSVMEKLKVAKLSIEFLSAGNSLLNELDKIQQHIDQKQKKGISDADLEAYESIEKAIEQRIERLNQKYKSLID